MILLFLQGPTSTLTKLGKVQAKGFPASAVRWWICKPPNNWCNKFPKTDPRLAYPPHRQDCYYKTNSYGCNRIGWKPKTSSSSVQDWAVSGTISSRIPLNHRTWWVNFQATNTHSCRTSTWTTCTLAPASTPARTSPRWKTTQKDTRTNFYCFRRLSDRATSRLMM